MDINEILEIAPYSLSKEQKHALIYANASVKQLTEQLNAVSLELQQSIEEQPANTKKKLSENEVHMARSFLMRILRNSMRYSLGFTITLLPRCNGFIHSLIQFMGSQVNTFCICGTHGFFFPPR